jgi:hypothetical protein
MSAHRVPRAGDVLRMQLKLLIGTKYVAVVTVLPLLGLMALHSFNPIENAPPWMVGPLAAYAFTGLIFTGGVAAMLAWLGESPRTRRYHWSLPVRRELHDTLRIVAGAMWLLASLGIYCVFAWLTEDAILREHWLARAPAFWTSVFLVPLLCYALVSLVALSAGKPLIWLAAVLIGIMALGSDTVERRAPAVANVYVSVFGADHAGGLGAALSGGLLSAPWSREIEKKRVYDATAKEYYARRGLTPPAAPISAAAPLQPFESPRLTVSEWVVSVGLWFGVALIAIAFVLRRRPDV